MRIILLLLFFLAINAMAFIGPGGLPTFAFEGKVLSTAKVGNFTGIEPKEWELWKLEVEVQQNLGNSTIITNKMAVYFDCPTNASSYFRTNQIYSFACIEHANIKSTFGLGTETNGLIAVTGFTTAISK